MPRLAASGPISRLGPLSLLHWVFLLRPVRLSARSMGSGADGCPFPSAVDLVYCHRFQYVFSFSYNSLRTGAVGRVSRLRSSISRSPLFRAPSLFLFACSRIACNCPLIFKVFKWRGRSLDWCRASCCCLTLQLSWSFRADTLAGCLRKSHVLYFGYAVHALKGSSFFSI